MPNETFALTGCTLPDLTVVTVMYRMWYIMSLSEQDMTTKCWHYFSQLHAAFIPSMCIQGSSQLL